MTRNFFRPLGDRWCWFVVTPVYWLVLWAAPWALDLVYSRAGVAGAAGFAFSCDRAPWFGFFAGAGRTERGGAVDTVVL
jgi:hypothetical protein